MQAGTLARAAAFALSLLSALAQAAGLTEIARREGDGPVTVFYPSSATAAPRGRATGRDYRASR